MMTATCMLCGVIVTADAGPMVLSTGDPAVKLALAEISQFDLLAGRMAQHLEIHQPQALEMAAVMHLAGKVYAMTWADDQNPNFQLLRESWRTGILQMMQHTTTPQGIYDALEPAREGGAGAGTTGEGGVSSEPSGSNVKNSARKASN